MLAYSISQTDLINSLSIRLKVWSLLLLGSNYNTTNSDMTTNLIVQRMNVLNNMYSKRTKNEQEPI